MYVLQHRQNFKRKMILGKDGHLVFEVIKHNASYHKFFVNYYICIGTLYKAYSIAYFNRLVLSCESTEGTLASETLLN